MKGNYEGTSLPNRGSYILFFECRRANVKYENGVGEMREKDLKDNQ